jgi:hypothetical protein
VSQESYSTLGTVEAGELHVHDRQSFERAMRRFPDGPVTVTVATPSQKRSDAQNKYWHGFVIPAFTERCGYEFAEMKDILALKLLPREIVDFETGEVRVVPGHTSKLTVAEFNDLIERAQRWGAELGVFVPDPEKATR